MVGLLSFFYMTLNLKTFIWLDRLGSLFVFAGDVGGEGAAGEGAGQEAEEGEADGKASGAAPVHGPRC